MYNRTEFSDFFFREIGSSQGTLNTYCSYLGRLDPIVGGIDERIAADGGDELLDWMKSANVEPIASHRSQTRSIIKAYIRFRESAVVDPDAVIEDPTPTENAATVFRYEQELQAAVRGQLYRLESGLVEDDGGYEASFDSGRADILARDVTGGAVVIELKAGPCPKGAIEQVLGYAQNWLDDGEATVRSVLIASSFSPRQIAAARLIPSLELKCYNLAVEFAAA